MNHPITIPTIRYYCQDAGEICTDGEDWDKNGTYHNTMAIHIGFAIDPDAARSVNHSIYLCNLDGTVNYTINNSVYRSNGAEMHIDFNTSLVTDGIYKVNITAVADDDAKDIQSTLTCENFTIDNTPPQFTFQGLTPANATTYSTTDRIDINISFVELHEDTCLLNWSATASNYTMTMDKTANTCVYTLGNIPDGTYTYYVWLNDTVGNSNVSETRTISFNTTAQWYVDHSGGGGGGAIIIQLPAIIDNITDVIEDVVEDVRRTIYISDRVNPLTRLVDGVRNYMNSTAYEFPACEVWDEQVNIITGVVEPVCIEHRHIKGNVVVGVMALLALLSLRWAYIKIIT